MGQRGVCRRDEGSARLWGELSYPGHCVAAVLTVLDMQAAGTYGSWWLPAVIVFVNLLVVRLVALSVSVVLARAVMLALVAVSRVRRAYAVRRADPPGPGEQGETRMTWSWTAIGIQFELAFDSCHRAQLAYAVTASYREQCARGWVRYTGSGAQRLTVDCLDFYEPPMWLREAVAPATARAGDAPAPLYEARALPILSVVFGEEVMAELAGILEADYRQRLALVLEQIEAGNAEPADYEGFWFYELCREAEVRPSEAPSARELAEAYRLVEAHASLEVREHVARVHRTARLERMARELERWNAWISEHLAGLVETSVFPLARIHLSGAPVFFAASRHDLAVTYEPIAVDDGETIGFLESVGDQEVAYVSPALAEQWYGEQWRDERGAAAALWVLGALLRSVGGSASEDNYLRWVYRREGVAGLVELARSDPPVEVSWRQVVFAALASKVYRIPLVVHAWGERSVGYGIPHLGSLNALALEDEQREQYLRLYGWVELGSEDEGAWPRPEDLAAHRREQRRLYAGTRTLLEPMGPWESPC